MDFFSISKHGMNELNKEETKILQGMAILMMVFLHLFCRKKFDDLYDVVLSINDLPIIYYISLLCGSCVPIYSFCSGYGLYSGYQEDSNGFIRKNFKRLIKLVMRFELILVITIIAAYVLSVESITSLDAIEVIKNIMLFEHSICGAWWYMQTYILLVVLSPILFKAIDKYNGVIVIIISCILYCFGYLQRTRYLFIPQRNWIIDDMVYMFASLLFCQFAFVVGVYTRKYLVISRIRTLINKKAGICISIIMIPVLLICHGTFESMVIDPIVGLVIIILFSLIRIKKSHILDFLGRHSTNIWLVHMLLYQHYAKEIIFASRIPVVIFAVTICLSIFISYVVNEIILLTIKWFDALMEAQLIKRTKNSRK